MENFKSCSLESKHKSLDHTEDQNHGNRQSYVQGNKPVLLPHRNMDWRNGHRLKLLLVKGKGKKHLEEGLCKWFETRT